MDSQGSFVWHEQYKVFKGAAKENPNWAADFIMNRLEEIDSLKRALDEAKAESERAEDSLKEAMGLLKDECDRCGANCMQDAGEDRPWEWCADDIGGCKTGQFLRKTGEAKAKPTKKEDKV